MKTLRLFLRPTTLSFATLLTVACTRQVEPALPASDAPPTPASESARESAAPAASAASADDAPAVLPAPVPGTTPPVSSGAGQGSFSGAAGIGASASSVTEAVAREAATLMREYGSEFEKLRANLADVKSMIDQHAGSLPAGVSAKYDELNALVSELGGLVESLKTAGTDKLEALTPRLQDGFARGQKLYLEIRRLLGS